MPLEIEYSGQGDCERCKEVTYDYFYTYPNKEVIAVCKTCFRQLHYLNPIPGDEEKMNINKEIKFTPEQIDFICYQIGDWYLMMKPLLEGAHNLGYMKEKLKTMICGE